MPRFIPEKPGGRYSGIYCSPKANESPADTFRPGVCATEKVRNGPSAKITKEPQWPPQLLCLQTT